MCKCQETQIQSCSGTHTNYWNHLKTDGVLSEIFNETKTDKLYTHHHDRFYEVFLSPYRNLKNMKILEIGAETGKSMMAWAKFFSNAELIQGVRYGHKTDSQK